MFMDELLEHLGSYCEDLKFNIQDVLSDEGTPGLAMNQVYGIALSCAYAVKNNTLAEFIFLLSNDTLSSNEAFAAKSAASIVAMNSVYYRFGHSVSNKYYEHKHPNLRMDIMVNPQIEKQNFELNCLAVSSIFGCPVCMDVHEKKLRKSGMSENGIHSCIRISAVINGVAQALAIG